MGVRNLNSSDIIYTLCLFKYFFLSIFVRFLLFNHTIKNDSFYHLNESKFIYISYNYFFSFFVKLRSLDLINSSSIRLDDKMLKKTNA